MRRTGLLQPLRSLGRVSIFCTALGVGLTLAIHRTQWRDGGSWQYTQTGGNDDVIVLPNDADTHWENPEVIQMLAKNGVYRTHRGTFKRLPRNGNPPPEVGLQYRFGGQDRSAAPEISGLPPDDRIEIWIQGGHRKLRWQ